MNLTSKQISILGVIAQGNDDKSNVDLDQIIERLSYKTSKESIQFSIRALISRELIVKCEHENRRGRKRVVIGLTEPGKSILFGSKPSVTNDSVIEEGFDDFGLAEILGAAA